MCQYQQLLLSKHTVLIMADMRNQTSSSSPHPCLVITKFSLHNYYVHVLRQYTKHNYLWFMETKKSVPLESQYS